MTDVNVSVTANLTGFKAAMAEMSAGLQASVAKIKSMLGSLVPSFDGAGTALKNFSNNRIGFLELQAAGINSMQALTAGMSPFRIAVMEGGQVLGAFIQGGLITFAGVMAALMHPLTWVIAALAALAGGYYLLTRNTATATDATVKYEDAIQKVNALTESAAQLSREAAEQKRNETATTLQSAIAKQTEAMATARQAMVEEEARASRLRAALDSGKYTKGVMGGAKKNEIEEGIRRAEEQSTRFAAALSQASGQLDILQGKYSELWNPSAGSKLGGELAGPSRVTQWRTELDEQLAASHNYYGDLTQAEITFWEQKRSLTAKGSAEQMSIDQQLFSLRRQQAQSDLSATLATINQKQAAAKNDYAETMALENEKLAILRRDYGVDSQQYQQELRSKEQMEVQHRQLEASMAVEWNQTQMKLREMDLSATRDKLDQELALGEITNKEKFNQLKTLTTEIYQLQRQSLQEQMSLDSLSVQEKTRIYQQIVILDKQHQLDLQKIDTQATQAQSKVWESGIRVVGNSMDTMLRGVLQGTQTWRQAMASLFGDLVLTVIEQLAKLGLAWAAHEAERLLMHETTNAAIVASDAAQSAASTAAQAGPMKEGILKHAGSAAAAVYDDVAQIPYVGWLLAPPAAAAAFAAVAAFQAFDVGAWELPSDTIGQLHKGEMIIPAQQASKIRSGGLSQAFAAGAASSNVGGAGVGPTLIIKALDSKDVAAWANANAGTLARVTARYTGLNPSVRKS